MERPKAEAPIFAAAMKDDRSTAPSNWRERLAKRWNVPVSRVLLILLVFACTGTTVMLLKRPIVAWVSGDATEPRTLFTVLYYILILPFYNVILLIFGALFGQFSFFWAFEKRFFARLFGGSRKPPAANE